MDDFDTPSALSYRIGPDYLVTPGLQNLMGVYGRARLRAGTATVSVLPRLMPAKPIWRAPRPAQVRHDPASPDEVNPQLDDTYEETEETGEEFDYRAGFTPPWDDWNADPASVWTINDGELEKLEED